MRVVVVRSQQELDACLMIRHEVFIVEQRVPEDLEVDEWDQLCTDVTHVLMYDDLQYPVATARLKPYQVDSVKIQRVAVRRSHRRQGYGRLIMRALEDIAKDNHYRKIILDAQCHAQKFYEQLYYQKSGDRFVEAGIEHIHMEKMLKRTE